MTGLNDALDVLTAEYTLTAPKDYRVTEYAVRLPGGHLAFMGTSLDIAERIAQERRGVVLQRVVVVSVPVWKEAP